MVSKIEVILHGMQVHAGNQEQVQPHAEISEGQIEHQEFRDVQVEHVRKEDYYHRQVPDHGRYDHQPHRHSQPVRSHDVLARIQRVRLGVALNRTDPGNKMT